jgi:hypothetical protein
MSIFILGNLSSIAIAETVENPLVNEVASKILKNNESSNQSSNQSMNQTGNQSFENQSESANITKTDEMPGAESNSKVNPLVVLRPVNDVITENNDGIVELYINNPSLNEILNFDARITVPDGIHVYGQGFSHTGSSNAVYGTFSVPAGSTRKIYIDLKGAKTGPFTLYLNGFFWNGDDKEDYTPISLTHSFFVKESSKEPEEPPIFYDNGEIKTEAGGSLSAPGFGLFIATAGLLAVYVVKRK